MKRSRFLGVVLRIVSLVAAVIYSAAPLNVKPAPVQPVEAAPVTPESPPEAMVAPCAALATGDGTAFSSTLIAAKDSTLDQRTPTTAYGTATTLTVGAYRPATVTYSYISLVGFDLTSLPADAVILTATLELRQTVAGAANIVAQALTGTWSETTVTWNTQPGYTRTDEATGALAGSTYRWDITPIVRKWTGGSLANYGVRLVTPRLDLIGPHTFSSRETKDQPRLVVAYARQVDLTVVADAHVSHATPNTNYGGATTMVVRDDTAGSGQHALLRFDLSSIPAGSSVISAALGVQAYFAMTQMSTTAADAVAADAVAADAVAADAVAVAPEALLAAWNESTVTWNSAPASEGRGDPVTTWADMAWNWFDVTAIASAWTSGTVGPYGIKLKPADATTGLAPFYAREGFYPAHLIITYGPVPCTPATGVTIGGATAGVTGADYTFTATILPTTTTGPITYTWQATGQTSYTGAQATRTYIWPTSGTKMITVTVQACGQSVADTHQVVISDPSPTCPTPLTGLTLAGAATGFIGAAYVYTATVIPSNATAPVAYTWAATDQTTATGPEATRTYTWPTPGMKTITVTAENCGGTIVQQTAVSVQPRPDLAITGAWYNQPEAHVYAIVRNNGDGTAPAGVAVSLSRDGSPVASAALSEALAPGMVRAVGIDSTWACAGALAQMRVCADATSIVPEIDEGNNCFQETWSCDLEPPQFTSGPTVSDVTETTAKISWTTSESCRSHLDYGQNGPWNASAITDGDLKTNHVVNLTGLEAGSLIWTNVSITDAADNLTISGGDFFETAPPGTDPPEVVSVDMVDYPSATYDFYILQAVLDDTFAVDRVEFSLDGQHIGTDTTPEGTLYEVVVSPAALGLTRAQWFAQHWLQVRAYNLRGDVTIETVAVTPAGNPMEVDTFIRKIAPSNSVYIGGSVAPVGTNVTVTTWAAEYRWGCYNESPETPPPGLEAVRCVDVRQDVQSVSLLLDGVEKKTYLPPAGELSHDLVIDLAGKSLGAHTLTVRATSSEGIRAERNKTITLLSGVTCADVTRQVTRMGNTFQVELALRNACNTQIILRGLDDRGLVGFYPAAGAGTAAYTLARTRYDTTTQRAGAEMTINNVVLNPGGLLTLRYIAVPVLHDQPYAGNDLAYSIGYETGGVMTYTVGTDPAVVERAFYTPWTGSVADALKAADYVIVTNPRRLDTFYAGQPADIAKLYATMARLAALKQGVLGFLGTHSFELLDTLLETTWGSQLHPNFMSDNAGGYALLVGESEIIPAWTESSFTIEWADGDETTTVSYSDLPYASLRGKDKRPEMVVGRIVGNSPAALITPIETSLAVATGTAGYNFDRSHALLLSGRGVDVEAEFIPGVNWVDLMLSAQGVDVTKIHWKYDHEPSYTDVFTDETPDKDIIYYFGHGNVGYWAPGLVAGASGVWPLDFGGSNPFVYATTCLSGGYEPDADSMPERFAASGAGVYIGATQVSANSANRSAGSWFFLNWGPDETTGKVLTNLKQHFVSDSALWRLWSYEYNLYGDPKYGALSPTLSTQMTAASATASATAAASATAETPPPTLDVHIPDFEVTSFEGWDSVEIPGGQVIEAPDQYRTPIWTVAVDYPAGVRAQAVTLTHRSEPIVTAGLQLTVTQNITSEPGLLEPIVAPAPGWYPQGKPEVSWRVEDNGDGTSQLIITLIPFTYDSAGGNAVFVQDYTFDIQTIAATAQIESLTMDEAAYRQGEIAVIDLLIGNSAGPQDVVVAAEIRSPATDATVVGFPLRSLKNLTDTVSLAFAWDTAGFQPGGVQPGSYEATVALYDLQGNMLDSDVYAFQVGITAAELTSLTSTPALVKAGQPIALSLGIKNTGSLPLNGTATLLIQDETGATVATLTQAVTALATGGTLRIDKTWTPQANEIYRAIGYVAYNSTTSDIRVLTLDPNARIYLPLVLK